VSCGRFIDETGSCSDSREIAFWMSWGVGALISLFEDGSFNKSVYF